MHLLLLFSLSITIAAFSPWAALEELKDKFKGKKFDLDHIRKNLGGNAEKRKERMAKWKEMFAEREGRNSTEDRKAFLEKMKLVRKVKTENELPEKDLFEVNEKAGLEDYLFQGDINLTDEQMDEIEIELLNPDNLRTKRQISTVYQKWTNGVVNYYLDASLNAVKKASITNAINLLESQTCIRFQQTSTAAARIKVFSGAGCYATIGMTGREQELSLGDGCEVVGTVVHEFTHALGIWHFQMRSDRDDYVSIDLSNVDPSKHLNFEKLSANEVTSLTPYEYGSMMHYGANSFVNTQGAISIVPNNVDYTYTMGNRQVTFYDIEMINKRYGCDAKCPAATSAQCQNGGTPNPNNCATCNCPSGFAGTLCNQRPAGCGESLAASTSWQSKNFQFGENSQTVRHNFTLCNYWITAPAGMQIQVKLTSMSNSQCQFGCPFNGVEIKRMSDKKMTSPLVCCPEFNNVEYTSFNNPMPIVAFNRYYLTSFTFQYRYVNAGAPPTTVAPPPPTTAPPAPPTNPACVDQNTPELCNSLIKSSGDRHGICSTINSFQVTKYHCAKTCQLCGKADPVCKDFHPDCNLFPSQGLCTSLHPLLAEYNCAQTCGFCTNPV